MKIVALSIAVSIFLVPVEGCKKEKQKEKALFRDWTKTAPQTPASRPGHAVVR